MCDDTSIRYNCDTNNGCLNSCVRNFLTTDHLSDHVGGPPCRITEISGDSGDHDEYAAWKNSMPKSHTPNCTQCQLLWQNRNTSFDIMRTEQILARDDDTSSFWQEPVCHLCIPSTTISANCIYCYSNTCNNAQYRRQIYPNDLSCAMCYVDCELCESSPRSNIYNSPMAVIQENPPSILRPLHESSPQCYSCGNCIPKPICCQPAANTHQCRGSMSANFPTQSAYPYCGPIITIYSNETRLHTD